MANSLTAFSPEVWAREMQQVFFKTNVAVALADTQVRDELKVGDTYNKPYRSYLRVVTYTKGTDITAQDVSGTIEYLSVDTTKVVPFYVDDVDKIQNKWDMALQYARDAQEVLNSYLDQQVLGQYSNAANYIDAGDVGGSAGSAISLTTSNVLQVFTALGRKLDSENISQRDRFAVIGPRVMETLRLYIAGKDTSMADEVGNNGKVGRRFGFDLYYSNNLAYSATWTPADNPTANDTVSIAGVTFTFVASPSSAGDVDIGGTTAVSIDNLVAAINLTGTAGTDYVAVSDDNRRKLTQAGIVATDGTTNMTIVGYGDVVVATSVDPWSVQKQYLLAGQKGAITLLVQKSPNVEFRMAEKRLGRYVYPWMLYGIKTFNDGAKQLVYAILDASAWV